VSSILTGKRTLITGATGGLGSALARAFGRTGARLFLSGRRNDALARTAHDLVEEFGVGLEVRTLVGDLRDPLFIRTVGEETRGSFGGVDILVNCAGIFPVSPIEDVRIEEVGDCFDVNVRAPFLLARELLPEMIEERWGRIVNIGSSSAYSGFKNTVLYCASKHALLGFSRALHDEVKEHNVRVLCISPGSIQTSMGAFVKGQDFETFLNPDQVAQIVVEMTAIDGAISVEEVRLNRMVIR
jgi:3-oxoacyl-[acyl-carrier protein] reductase